MESELYRWESSPWRRRRRWPLVAFLCVVVLVLLLVITAGVARATSDAASTARNLASRGQYGQAVAMYRTVAGRTGPLFLFDQADVQAAEGNAQRTMLSWAAALGRAGHADQALVIAAAVTDPALSADARQARSSLLVAGASADAAQGKYESALHRLDQISQLGLSNTGPAAGRVPQLQVQYLVAEAQAQLQRGDGVAAVGTLDKTAAAGPGGAVAAAPLLPQALLAEAAQEIDAGSPAEAAAALQRLVAGYGASPQAREARAMLAEGQPVTGTLVDRTGNPLSAQVRLSSHFFSEPGGYLTSGPFFYADADSAGNFRFTDIPPGGPYVFEIFRGGNWLTFVDPNTGQPANPVTVSAVTPVDLAFITVS